MGLNKRQYTSFVFTDHSKAVLLIWFYVFTCLVSVSVLFSPSLCLDDIQLDLGN